MKNNPPNYIIKLIKEFPLILSGRKNYKNHHKRIIITLSLINKYLKKNTP